MNPCSCTEHKCNRKEIKELRKRAGQILLREGETTASMKGWIQIVVVLFTIIEVAIVLVLFNDFLENYIPNFFFGWLIRLFVFIVVYFASKVVFLVINFFLICKVETQIKKRYVWRLHDISVNGAMIVKADGTNLFYIEDGVFDVYHRPVVIKEKFAVDMRIYNKQTGRLVLIRGKNKKEKEILQVMLADDVLEQCIGTFHPKVSKKRNISPVKWYPHCNAVSMDGKKKVLSQDEADKFVHKYRKFWMYTWGKRIGSGIFLVAGLFQIFLYLMYDNQEITRYIAKNGFLLSVLVSFFVFFFVMVLIFVRGKKKIIFHWKREIIFIGMECEKVESKGSVTRIKGYEQGENEFLLKTYKSDGLHHNFQYGEIIYLFGNNGEQCYFLEK